MSHQSDSFLTLLQFADSALPIGSTAHSFGLETLVFDGDVTVAELAEHFRIYLEEAGLIEAAYARAAYAIGLRADEGSLQADQKDGQAWLDLNCELSARKWAREGRDASATLGRRLLRHALSLTHDERLRMALHADQDHAIHHAAAFGLIGGIWRMDREQTILAFLQQTLTGLVSACQRLMPLGQNRAQHIIWSLRPALIHVANRVSTDTPPAALPMFTPLLEVGGMRHPNLPVRLFVS